MEVADYYLRTGQKEMQMKKQGYASYEMTCLTGELMEDYLHDIEIIQEFARLNREAIIESIIKGMKWKLEDSFTCIHNYVDFSGTVSGDSDKVKPILRKGAISAKEGDKVIIPINMRDGIILGTGRGNADWNYSAPHGAGRIMSRSAAKEQLDLEEYRREMAGIYTTSVNEATLDEAPMAYKSLSDIIGVIRDTVDIIEVLKPIYNFKAN